MGAAVLARHRWLWYPMAPLIGYALGVTLFHVSPRLVIALVVLSLGIGTVFRWPMASLLIALGWLLIDEFVRRLLLLVSNWSSFDPLLLVAPAILAVYCTLYPVFGRPWNRLTRLMLGVTAAALVEAVSPLGAGLRANLTGALFIVTPLLWYFAGRTVTPRTVATILRWLPAVGLIVLAYGLRQLFVGFLPWDQTWADQARYGALNVGGILRPFGIFPSGAEYELFLLCAAVISFAGAFRAKVTVAWLLVPLGLAFAVGAFLVGGRGGMVNLVAALGVLWSCRKDRGRLPRLLLTLALATGGYFAFVYGHNFAPVSTGAEPSTAASLLVDHQLQGLSHPLNSKSSTVGIHLQLEEQGFVHGFRHPLGEGLGVITLAGSVVGANVDSSEVDVPNMFIASGPIGGTLYLAVFVLALCAALSRPQRSLVDAALPAILVLTYGEWLNGGYYFVSAFIWLLMGHTLGTNPEASRVATERPGPLHALTRIPRRFPEEAKWDRHWTH